MAIMGKIWHSASWACPNSGFRGGTLTEMAHGMCPYLAQYLARD